MSTESCNVSPKRSHSPKIENVSVVSYGVACVRRNPDTSRYELLVIKKRYTYQFIEFVRGMYDPHKTRDIEFMFEGMTIGEKSMIQTRNFDAIWHYCNGEPTRSCEKSLYVRSARKFNLLVSRGILLELMTGTTNASLLWEIPKGRANKRETALRSAMREFEEETGLPKDAYRLLIDEGTIEYSFIDCGVKYKYVFYIALIKGGVEPKYDYTNEHMLRELGDIRFLTANVIQEMNGNRLASVARVIIKKAKKYLH